MTDTTAPGNPTAQGHLRLALGLLALIWAIGTTMLVPWHHQPPDMSALYMAGRLWAEGDAHLIYAAPEGFFGGTPPAWDSRVADWGLTGNEALAYIYPPLWAAALSPLAGAMEPLTFFRTASILSALATFASVLLAWRMARSFAVPLWAWCLIAAILLKTSLIFYMSMYLLQPQIVVIMLCLAAFERYGAGSSRLAGVLLGLAAALKLTPAGLALLFLIDRNWRAVAAMAATLAGLATLSLWVGGPGLHTVYLDTLATAGGGLYVNAVNYSAEVPLHGIGVFLGILPHVEFATQNIRITSTPPFVAIAGKALALGGLVWMVLATRALEADKRLVARLFLTSLLLNLFGPLGWAHYFQLQVLLLPALLGLLPLARGWAVLAATGLLTSWPFVLWLSGVIYGDFFRAAFGSAVMMVLFVTVTGSLDTMGRRRGATGRDNPDALASRGLA